MAQTCDRLPFRHHRERAIARALGAFRLPTSALTLLPSAQAFHVDRKAGAREPGANVAPNYLSLGNNRPLVGPPRSQMQAPGYDGSQRSKKMPRLFFRRKIPAYKALTNLLFSIAAG
jgi:hypothetical protein